MVALVQRVRKLEKKVVDTSPGASGTIHVLCNVCPSQYSDAASPLEMTYYLADRFPTGQPVLLFEFRYLQPRGARV